MEVSPAVIKIASLVWFIIVTIVVILLIHQLYLGRLLEEGKHFLTVGLEPPSPLLKIKIMT